MGNQVSHGLSSLSPPPTGKVILLDGSIQEFDKPLTVAELMLEYPQQVVVELKVAASVQNKPTPLPADKLLEADKFYLMVPLRRSGKPAHLSPQQAHQILLRANALLRSSSKTLVPNSSKFLPFFARICPAGDASFKVVEPPKKMEKLEEGERDEGVEEQLIDQRPDYLSRTLSGRGWKPSLDPIEEKKNEIKRGSNWVLLASKVSKRVAYKGLVWG